MKELEGDYLVNFKNGYPERDLQISKLPLWKEREILSDKYSLWTG